MARYIFLLLFLFASGNAGAQVFYRIRADFVLKAKYPGGKQQLTVGKVFYDRNLSKLVYHISFPEKETWVQNDSVLVKITDSMITEKQKVPAMLGFSIFNLVLNGNLDDYGLKKTSFRIKNVEKSGNKVISTWEPPVPLKPLIGDILLSNVNQQLDGIIFKNTKGEVVTRQFFRNYIKVNGLSFPRELIKESIVNDQKVYELTNFSNILINESSGDDNYDFRIPAY